MSCKLTSRRVLLRWKLSYEYSENYWEKSVPELRQFQKKYDEAQRISHLDLQGEEAQKILNDFAFRKDGTAPTFGDTSFRFWMRDAFVGIGYLEELKFNGAVAVDVADGRLPVSKFLTELDRYSNAIQNLLDQASPKSFRYGNFEVANEYRMSEEKCRKMLEGVDYLVALFKKRGLTDVFKENIKSIRLIPNIQGAAGLYLTNSKDIVLSGSTLDQDTGRFMTWVNEVFLHEFGHHVHLAILPKDAKRAWDEGWDEVKEKGEALSLAFKNISRQERETFFSLMERSGWDPVKVAKKLDAVRRVKFGVWLRSPMVGDPLITDKQFRLTATGKYLFSFFEDPEKFMKDNRGSSPEDDSYTREITRTERMMKDKLGLLYAGNFSIPIEVVEELMESDNQMQKSVNEALDRLDIVSPYGKVNEKEDFAESFVAFVGAPEKLTPTAKFRMQRTLSLAGLYGKEIMKLARQGLLLSVGQ